MIKVTCDRCGRQIGTTLPWMNPEYPVLTITSQVRTEEKPRMIDLCPVCKVKFYDWLDNESRVGLSEEQTKKWSVLMYARLAARFFVIKRLTNMAYGAVNGSVNVANTHGWKDLQRIRLNCSKIRKGGSWMIDYVKNANCIAERMIFDIMGSSPIGIPNK